MAKSTKRPNPFPVVVPDSLGGELIHHLTGHPKIDERIMQNFCTAFGFSRRTVETFLWEKNFLPQNYRTLH